ncbi:hypothetical protein O3M35_009814 [Rhynocoris fuscipes]|uniref:ubiquitinyl hydrolase 1 n=1 Tax=Rhynocoris fuscipes TaxID=488301 RepID=A0AAW1D525_9HEMI
MGKKRSRQQQCSNVAVATADSSESGDGAAENTTSNKPICSHVAKSIDGNQIKKNISFYINGKKTCSDCKDHNEEDNDKISEANEDFWACLRCGARSCSLEHSSLHFDVPRSDSHALSLKIPTFSVWCHGCKTDIPSSYSKKLKTCITSIEQFYNKQINLQPMSQIDNKSSSKASKDENSENKENKPTDPIPLPPPKKSSPVVNNAPVVRGLTNLGNTCFFNSVLQCLAQTPGLVEAIREMKTPDQEVDIVLKSGTVLKGKLGQWDSLSESLADTLVKLKSGGPVVSPDRLLSLLTKKQTQFQGYRQHDAHELFTYLIDSVRMADHKRYRKLILSEFGLYGKNDYQDVPEDTTKKLKTLDHEVADTITFAPEKVFQGRLVNRIQCQECRSMKTFEETFMDLSLPIVADKPQPPCMRRKGGHQNYNQNQFNLEPVEEENKSHSNGNSRPTMSKTQLKKERRAQRQKNRKQGKNNCNNNNNNNSNNNNNNAYVKGNEGDAPLALMEDGPVDGVEEVKTRDGQQESDVEGDVEDNSEETNCGSKEPTFPKHPEPHEGGDCDSADVNCGNEGVWLDSNESMSSNICEKDKYIQNDIISTSLPLLPEREEGSNITSYLLGIEESVTVDEVKRNDCAVKEEPSVSSSVYVEENNIDSKQGEERADDVESNYDPHVTAWLKTSNLINVPEADESSRDVSPPLTNDPNNTEVIGPQNRLSPQTHTSICSNQQESQPSLDETRSLLAGTLETQESGYCSEKLGCPESSQREDSPCSLDGFSPAWSGVEGALSSRSEDVSIEEVFNNTTVAGVEEDESTETTEDTAALLSLPPSDGVSKTVASPQKKTNWMRNHHPPAHVRRRAPSVPPMDNPETNGDSALNSAIMCSKWLEDNSRIPSFDDRINTTQGIAFNEKVDMCERELDAVPEEEETALVYGPLNQDSCTVYDPFSEDNDVVYGPLNRDELVNGDLDVSDSNSNNGKQGSIARPSSPYEEGNENSDLKNLDINIPSLLEDIPFHYNSDSVENKEIDESSDKVSESVNRNAAGDRDLGCGCNRIQRQDSSDNCCLHTSLAQSTQAELMTGCNKIVCDACTSGNADGKAVYTNSTKQTLISYAPPALVIHLKRFQVQMMTCRKLSRHVSFPLQLDLTPYSVVPEHNNLDGPEDECKKTNLLYNLYGVVEHSGTMNGGHYVAYVKVTRNDFSLWYCISDSHVSQVLESRVLSAQAYLLFYKQNTT